MFDDQVLNTIGGVTAAVTLDHGLKTRVSMHCSTDFILFQYRSNNTGILKYSALQTSTGKYLKGNTFFSVEEEYNFSTTIGDVHAFANLGNSSEVHFYYLFVAGGKINLAKIKSVDFGKTVIAVTPELEVLTTSDKDGYRHYWLTKGIYDVSRDVVNYSPDVKDLEIFKVKLDTVEPEFLTPFTKLSDSIIVVLKNKKDGESKVFALNIKPLFPYKDSGGKGCVLMSDNNLMKMNQNCLTCDTGFAVMTSNYCAPDPFDCPSSTYWKDSIIGCEACPNNCLECSASGNCTNCGIGVWTGTTCKVSCAADEYLVAEECEKKVEQCDVMYEKSPTLPGLCKSCDAGWEVDENFHCELICPDGQARGSSGGCETCPSTCYSNDCTPETLKCREVVQFEIMRTPFIEKADEIAFQI